MVRSISDAARFARQYLDGLRPSSAADDASLQIEARERVSVIGRNGTGKSTLLQIISGDVPQEGAVWRQPGLRIGRLVQDALFSDDRPRIRRGR